MELGEISKSKLTELAAGNVVRRYVVGFDTEIHCSFWKLEFKSGQIQIFYLTPAIAVHFSNATRRAARELKWPAASNLVDDGFIISACDWTNVSVAKMVTRFRVDAFRNACIVALQVEKDLFHVIQLGTQTALQIAQELWDSSGSCDIWNVASQPSPGSSLQ